MRAAFFQRSAFSDRCWWVVEQPRQRLCHSPSCLPLNNQLVCWLSATPFCLPFDNHLAPLQLNTSFAHDHHSNDVAITKRRPPATSTRHKDVNPTRQQCPPNVVRCLRSLSRYRPNLTSLFSDTESHNVVTVSSRYHLCWLTWAASPLCLFGYGIASIARTCSSLFLVLSLLNHINQANTVYLLGNWEYSYLVNQTIHANVATTKFLTWHANGPSGHTTSMATPRPHNEGRQRWFTTTTLHQWRRPPSIHYHHNAHDPRKAMMPTIITTRTTTAWQPNDDEQRPIHCLSWRDRGPHQDRTQLRQERGGSAWQQVGWWMRGMAASCCSGWCQVRIWISDSFSQCWCWMHVARSKSYGIFFLSVETTLGSPKGRTGAQLQDGEFTL